MNKMLSLYKILAMKKEALKLVESLNNETWLDGVSLEFYEPFDFRSNGRDCAIYFMGIILWTDDNDEREWETEHEKESLRTYLIRESKIILSDVNKRMAQI